MELIDGAPLGEHFTSLKEKKESFTEPRIWNIFIQIVLALRYLHKEKHIVHRDLTPNNIMLSENDKVTISELSCHDDLSFSIVLTSFHFASNLTIHYHNLKTELSTR